MLKEKKKKETEKTQELLFEIDLNGHVDYLAKI